MFRSSFGRLLLSAGLSALLACPALADTRVEIIRDNWGVPHVYADDVHGLYAGFGYSVAQDRLFQMEMARRSVLGEVAEVLGIERLPAIYGFAGAWFTLTLFSYPYVLLTTRAALRGMNGSYSMPANRSCSTL